MGKGCFTGAEERNTLTFVMAGEYVPDYLAGIIILRR